MGYSFWTNISNIPEKPKLSINSYSSSMGWYSNVDSIFQMQSNSYMPMSYNYNLLQNSKRLINIYNSPAPIITPQYNFSFPSFNNFMPTFLVNSWNTVSNNVHKTWNTVSTYGQNVWNTVKTKTKSVWNTVKTGFDKGVKKVTQFFKHGEARLHANYTAISNKVYTYGKNSKFIEKLHPAMQEKVMQLLDWAKSNGISLTITSGFRSGTAQKNLQYKNRGGRKVAAAPGSSPHEYGIAIDFRSSNDAAVGKKAKELGMRWGGDWGKNWSRESWHIDMSNTIKKVRA